MKLEAVLSELKAMGTEQNRKVYARHGVHGECYGVSYANLHNLQRKIRSEHELALRLWETGNHDARVLATKVADPAIMDQATLRRWVLDLDNYVLTDALSSLVACTEQATTLAEEWVRSDQEWIASAGWTVLCNIAARNPDLPSSYLAGYLPIIEGRIHSSPNRVRYAMNNMVIAVGARDPELRERAIETARRIGEVQVDHGATGCKTPDAVSYIQRIYSRKKPKARP